MPRRLSALALAALCLGPGCGPRESPQGPDTYRVRVDTSKGDFVVQVTRDWAPRGADRFHELVTSGFYDDVRFFRVIRSPKPFMVQFGISGDPRVSARWSAARLPDDPVQVSNTRGRISYGTAGPNTRTTQVFINYADNRFLDRLGFAPFGEVISGMEVVDSLYAEYGEGPPEGRGPDQGRMEKEGNAYLVSGWPELDYIRTARIVESPE